MEEIWSEFQKKKRNMKNTIFLRGLYNIEQKDQIFTVYETISKMKKFHKPKKLKKCYMIN